MKPYVHYNLQYLAQNGNSSGLLTKEEYHTLNISTLRDILDSKAKESK